MWQQKSENSCKACARTYAWEQTITGIFTIHFPLFSFPTFPTLSQKRHVTFLKTTRHFSEDNTSLFQKQHVTFPKTTRRCYENSSNFFLAQPTLFSNSSHTFFDQKRGGKNQFDGITSFLCRYSSFLLANTKESAKFPHKQTEFIQEALFYLEVSNKH